MNREQRNRDEIDAILAQEDEIAPASGFLARVMEKVQEEAAAPPPIPFPWKRAIPGFVLAAGVFGWGAVEMVRLAASEAAAFTLPKFHLGATVSEPMQQAGWVVVALAVSAAAWMLSRRIAGQSGLL
jgi:hypothetical protein